MQLLFATSLNACANLKFDTNVLGFNSAGLGVLAKTNNRLYGAAVQSALLSKTDYAASFIKECALLVPEAELKWKALRPNETTFDFSGYDRIKEFAQANKMAVRGHTLVWHDANPAWLENALKNKRRAEKILAQHIKTVIQHTSPFIGQWDAVNEAVSPHSTRPDGLRDSCWLKALGPSYIPLAFHMAHDADKNLELVYNDYGLEYGDGNGFHRRKHILALLEKLKKQNVPVHALGLQSHLRANIPLGGKEFTKFLAEVRGMGLQVYVTELDIETTRIPGTLKQKSEAAQNYLSIYLDMVQEGAKLDMLLTWGLSDKYSWLNDYYKGIDGMLPLDDGFNRSPVWETLRSTWAERKA